MFGISSNQNVHAVMKINENHKSKIMQLVILQQHPHQLSKAWQKCFFSFKAYKWDYGWNRNQQSSTNRIYNDLWGDIRQESTEAVVQNGAFS